VNATGITEVKTGLPPVAPLQEADFICSRRVQHRRGRNTVRTMNTIRGEGALEVTGVVCRGPLAQLRITLQGKVRPMTAVRRHPKLQPLQTSLIGEICSSAGAYKSIDNRESPEQRIMTSDSRGSTSARLFQREQRHC
jgi:hypothetical protein